VNPHECPTCESMSTVVVRTESFTFYVKQVRHCSDCRTEYVISYAVPKIVAVRVDP